MGIKLFSDSSSDNGYYSPNTTFNDGNPNKYRFKLVRRLDVSKGADVVSVVEINYPDCHNYKGNKILVYSDASILDKGLQSRCLDPHFLESEGSPIARFEPTENGWILALSLAKMMVGDTK